jgi:PKD repeat protein
MKTKFIVKALPIVAIYFLALLLSGCYKDPTASFTMSSSTIKAGGSVTCTNTSAAMNRCEWLFGDGKQSQEINPVHIYTEPGTYQVTLRVFSKKDMKADIATAALTVIQPTTL